jgi:hypothetical protein
LVVFILLFIAWDGFFYVKKSFVYLAVFNDKKETQYRTIPGVLLKIEEHNLPAKKLYQVRVINILLLAKRCKYRPAKAVRFQYLFAIFLKEFTFDI